MSTDAVVVGSGPNGLAAAVTLARAGVSVELIERLPYLGGGAATRETTLPGFHHDLGSAVHPMAFASPFFRAFGLPERTPFVTPDISYAHPLDGGRAAVAYRSVQRTADELGADGAAWLRLFAPLLDGLEGIVDFTSHGLLRFPRRPFAAAALALRIAEQGSPLWNARFRGDAAPALLSGVLAHSVGSMPSLATAASGMTLATHAHAGGWPVPVGGSGAIVSALVDDLLRHGGKVSTDREVTDVREFDSAKAVLFDTTPRSLVAICGDRLSVGYRRALSRFRYGNAVAKLDLALSGPVPWKDPVLGRAPTLHLGGTRQEIAAGERAVHRGRHPESPYVLLSQPSVVDATRAPGEAQTLWTYTHVPSGSDFDVSERILGQIERFAPGFRDTVLAADFRSASDMNDWNPNYIGGDIFAGGVTLRQLVQRPVLGTEPWRAPGGRLYLCSSSTPPGPGVHGLAGWHAARSALKHEFGRLSPDLRADV